MLDLTGQSVPAAGTALITAYDAAAPGAEIAARLSHFPPALRMWLIEAGARHRVTSDGDASLVTLTRAAAPALTAAPGVHHIVAHANGSLWAAKRGPRVARIDGATGAVAAAADVARKASHLAVDPSGRWLYVADFAAGELIVLNAMELSVEARLPAPGGPQLPHAVADGVCVIPDPGTNALTVVDREGGHFRHRLVDVGSTPHGAVATSDGRHVFVACTGAGDVAKVDVAEARVVGRIATGAGAGHVAAHPDGQRFYCANSFDGTLTGFTGGGEPFGCVVSGGWAHHPEVSRDGHHVYVANFLDDSVTVFDAASLDRIAVLETEPYAHDLAVSPDGAYLIVPGYSSDHVRIFETQRFDLVARLLVGRGSPHAAFAADGRTVYVTSSIDDRIAAIDLTQLEVSNTLAI